ncbi:MAG: hypothetical protein ABI376_09040, partial [Caulobacteraceae bacterium]
MGIRLTTARSRYSPALAAAVLALSLTVHAAAAQTVTFDQLDGSDNESPLNYYAGGYGSLGTGPGPNFGITFSSNTLTGCELSSNCANTIDANEAPSSPNLAFFVTGPAITMDVAGGFTRGVSLYYSAPNEPGYLNVWSGVDDTGALLASVALPMTENDGNSGCMGANFCPFYYFAASFAG